MGLVQYNGEGLNETKVVWYEGTGTLKTGEVLCYDDDDTNAPVALPAGSLTVPPTSAILPRNLRGREVKDPATAILYAVAGVVAAESSGLTGPGWVTLIVPRKGDAVTLFTNGNCTKGTTVLGAADATRTASVVTDSGYNLPALAICLQTVDRSSTNGTVLAKFI